MSFDQDKVVPMMQTIIEINHSVVDTLDLDTPYFTEINPFYKNKGKDSKRGVYSYHSLNSLLERLKKPIKIVNVLKGIYEGGIKGQYCVKGSPFLFFQIQVNSTQNKYLKNSYERAILIDNLEKVSILTIQTADEKRIMGVLYVPQLKNYLNIQKSQHFKIGKAVNKYLVDKLDLKVSFSEEQNWFRNILQLEKGNFKLNTSPAAFKFSVLKKEVISQSGVKLYQYSDKRPAYGTIAYQFNECNNVASILLNNGFQKIDNGYTHPKIEDGRTGQISNNLIYFKHPSTLKYNIYTPFRLSMIFSDYYTENEYIKYLKEEGYSEEKPEKTYVNQALKIFKDDTQNRKELIFKACYNLINLGYEEKLKFINKNAKNKNEELHFYEYLKIKKLVIPYDKKLTIKKYVSEQLEEILNYSDSNNKVIIKAETGTGKTTAFLRDFKKLRPNKRLLILVPLTIIADQTKIKYENIVTLTGSSDFLDHRKALTANIVMATYEQGTKYLQGGTTFDYILIDEAHNLITANSYKSKQIKKLTECLTSNKVIGLTGTSNLLFKSIDYKLLNIEVENQKKVKAIMRIDNRSSLKIILQHIGNIKGKAIFRLNSSENLKMIKEELVSLGKYRKDQILILESTRHIKEGVDFQNLSSTGKFRDNVEIVLTTGIIDEGLSINQEGFTDIVFIENQYYQTPEAVKQFSARYRNIDPNRKIFYYYKETKEQKRNSFNPFIDFTDRKTHLKEDIKDRDIEENSGRDIANMDQLYYATGIIDEYFLAYVVNQSLFKKVTTEEYMFFLKENYNLYMEIDYQYTKNVINTTEIQLEKKHNKKLIASTWIKEEENILYALYKFSHKKEILDEIEYNGELINDKIMDSVNKNLKLYERIFINNKKLKKIGVSDINDILFPEGTINERKTNRKIKLLENIETIKSPTTITDKKNKKKLLKFIDEVSRKDSFNSGELVRLWKRQRVTSMNISGFHLIDLAQHFLKYTKDKKTRRFYKPKAVTI